jgi:pilus assembly protein Flp/PilA
MQIAIENPDKFDDSALPYFQMLSVVVRTGSTFPIRTEEFAMSKFMRFIRDESGATAIEYGLIAAGISVAIITVVASLGSGLNTTFTSVATALK